MLGRAVDKKKADAFAVVAKAGGIPSPAGSANVDWLSLSTTQGALAKNVFRVDTKAGQPPASVRNLVLFNRH